MQCLICGDANAIESPTAGDYIAYRCKRCGKVSLTGSVAAQIADRVRQSATNRAKLAHFFRRRDEDSGSAKPMNSIQFEAVLANPLPRPREQADLLVRLLAQRDDASYGELDLSFSSQGYAIGSPSPEAFEMVLTHLLESNLIAGRWRQLLGVENSANAALTFTGWEKYEQLRSTKSLYRRAFMAMKFGDDTLDGVLASTFRPAVKRAGFELRRLDDEPKAGLIDNRLRAEIQAADFVVADLTHNNLGAYWEAGYAEGLGKPVIYTCSKEKFDESKTHFDTNHHTTIIWDNKNPVTLSESAAQLTATVRATLPHVARMTDAEEDQ